MAKRRMTRPKAARLLGALGLALGLATGTTARPGGLQIDWWTTDTGGGASSGGSFTLSGTGGQPDAGRQADLCPAAAALAGQLHPGPVGYNHARPA